MPEAMLTGQIAAVAACRLQHFDVSYDAFELLAHPVYGLSMVEFRPVDCDTDSPLPFEPGFISRDFIYRGGPRAGWSWYQNKGSAFKVIDTTVTSPAGTAATCLTMGYPKGNLQFNCRDCYKAGYQPFEGAAALRFWIQDSGAGNTTEVPGLKLILLKAETGNYCAAEPSLTALTPTQTAPGGWRQFTVPMSAFNCAGGGISLADPTQLDFENETNENIPVCIADLELVR